jgi:hypothetical protein
MHAAVSVMLDAAWLPTAGLALAQGRAGRARTALLTFLREQGLPQVQVSVLRGGERVRGRTGKLQRVVAATPECGAPCPRPTHRIEGEAGAIRQPA